MNKGTKDSEVKLKYQQDISNVNYAPEKPAGVPANFTFAGWYDNELCAGTAYVFDGKTMPAQNITLYAKWQAPVIEAKVYLTASADGEVRTINVEYGKKLSDSKDFKALLEKFKEEQPSAWIDSNGALFNVDTELYSSVTISPFFPSAKDGFTVTYVEGTNVKMDNQKYVNGSSARVLSPENSENFRAWEMEGKLIYPGDKITVTKNTTLTAVYTNKPQTVAITYHYNFGDNTQPFIDSGYPKNTTATVRSYDYVGFFAPTGYEFLGWATTPNGNVEYQPNKKVFVDANDDNNLYAVWQVKTYTVTWVNWDNKELEKDEDVPYGATPKYDGKEPTKAGNAQYSYKFTGWNPALSPVTGDVTYKAQFEAVTNKYTVTWVNWDNKELEKDEDVPYGATPKYDGKEPTKAGNAQYSYKFTGWNPALSPVTGDVTYKAQFEAVTNKYTVTWVNWDNKELEKDEDVPYGATPKYDGKEPTKAGNAQYSYKFTGWNPALSPVTGDVTYKAQFEAVTNKYTVTWVNWDNKELEKDEDVPYGATPKYDGKEPTKAGNAQYSYKFTGWNPALSPVTGDVTYKAQFEAVTNKYTVTWVNWDNKELEKDEDVPYGATPKYDGKEPTKAGNAQYSYKFTGWNPALSPVTGDVTYKAQFEAVTNKYTVTWVNWDNKELEKDEDVPYGATPKYDGKEPTKAGNAQYSYKFTGWNPALSPVTGDVTYKAQFEAVTNKYTVTWVNWDNKELEKDEDVPYGATPKYDGKEPTKAGNAQYSYKFTGWNPALSPVTGDVTYKAQFEAVTNKYTVTWVNWDNKELEKDEDVPYGADPEYDGEEPTKAADAQYTYTFKGWTPEVETVTGDATYKATYTKEANSYTLTYDLDGGEWENDTTYTYPKKYNEEVEVKADPTKEGYTFAGWTSAEVKVVNGKFTMPAKNVTLTAQWKANIYKVTYDLDGGEWTETTNEFPYEYKATVEVIKTVPTREGYKFSGWRSEEVTIENDAFTMPAKDVVLKAVWEANPTPTPIPSEEPTPTPAPSEEPTPTPAPTEEPTPTPAPTEEPTPTPAPTEEPTPTPAPTEEPTPTPAPTEGPTPTPAPTEGPTPTPAPTEESTPTPAPNPNPNPNPATPTPTPVAPVVPATVATPTPTPTATPSTTPSDNGGKGDGNNDGEIGETINDNETPLANGEDIADNATPLAGLGTGAWALINLILTIVTTLLSILLLIGYIGKKKKALEDEDGNVVLDENGKEVMEYEKNKKGLWRLISIIPALIAIIVFIFTEDMTLPMIFVDKWTILHVVIALVQVVVMVLCKKRKDENDEDENAANA